MKTHKVLLVNPGNIFQGFSFPMGLLYVARSLIQLGIDVSIHDTGYNLIGNFNREKYLFVGITMLTGDRIAIGLKIARMVKIYDKTIPIVLGGVHPSLLPVESLKNNLVDIVVIGEGEETVKELATALLNNSELTGIKGIAFKNKNGEIIVNPPRPLIDINKVDTDLPYHLFGEYFISKAPSLAIHTSRGCPYRCGFCYSAVFHKRKYRQKSAETVVEEIGYYYKKYNIPKYDFNYEDEFLIDINRAYEIFQLIINRGLKIQWQAYCRFDTLDTAIKRFGTEFLKLLKRSGCWRLIFGAESGSQRLLDEIVLKDIKVEQIYKMVEYLRDYQIVHRLGFINCLPTETEDDIEATFKLIEKVTQNNPYISIGIVPLKAYPGTYIFDLLVKNYNFQPPSSLEEWGEFDKKYKTIGKYISWLTKEQVKKRHTIFLMTFYPFHQNFSSYREYKQFVQRNEGTYPSSYFSYLVSKIQYFRYKKRFFKFACELMISLKISETIKNLKVYFMFVILRRYLPPQIYETLKAFYKKYSRL